MKVTDLAFEIHFSYIYRCSRVYIAAATGTLAQAGLLGRQGLAQSVIHTGHLGRLELSLKLQERP